ncbi:ATP-binding protein [Streptomyces sp. SID8359]|uniref:ATP-binding protein n=1 Tax=unclassified Streptomyces TaxID=2593676 RepID=UPI000491649E|nr:MULTISPECIES: ATP-binding protein [unclassified Streptomyces]MYT91805.1 ATP-binding protein [Streptomyces sp. SID8359]
MTTMRPSALPSTSSVPPRRTSAVLPQAIYSAEPESVRPARRYVREAAVYQEPSIDEDVLDTLELLASELVTNAVRYGSEPGDSFKVTVAAEPGKCRLEVHDTRRRAPCLRPPSDQRTRGRGLHLVDALASRWGVAERPFGKVVWAVVTW